MKFNKVQSYGPGRKLPSEAESKPQKGDANRSQPHTSGIQVCTPPQRMMDLPESPSGSSTRYNLRDRSPFTSPRTKKGVTHVRDIEPSLWEQAFKVVDQLRQQQKMRMWPSFQEGEIIDPIENARLTLSPDQILRPAFCSQLRPLRKISTFVPGKIASILDDIIHHRRLMPLKIESIYLVNDGNHRLAVLRELHFEQVWVVERNSYPKRN